MQQHKLITHSYVETISTFIMKAFKDIHEVVTIKEFSITTNYIQSHLNGKLVVVCIFRVEISMHEL